MCEKSGVIINAEVNATTGTENSRAAAAIINRPLGQIAPPSAMTDNGLNMTLLTLAMIAYTFESGIKVIAILLLFNFDKFEANFNPSNLGKDSAIINWNLLFFAAVLKKSSTAFE